MWWFGGWFMALFYPHFTIFYPFFSSKYGIVLPHDFGTFTHVISLLYELFPSFGHWVDDPCHCLDHVITWDIRRTVEGPHPPVDRGKPWDFSKHCDFATKTIEKTSAFNIFQAPMKVMKSGEPWWSTKSSWHILPNDVIRPNAWTLHLGMVNWPGQAWRTSLIFSCGCLLYP